MGINWRQFELGVLRPTLEGEPEVAIKLVGETIWHESDRLQALGQYPRDPDAVFGPGLGIASIEEATWDWMVGVVSKPQWITTDYGVMLSGGYERLAYDLRLNVLACRFRYKMNPRLLPLLTNGLPARAGYWLSIYSGSGVESRRQAYITNALDIPWVK